MFKAINLSDLIQNISETLDKKSEIDIVYIDLPKVRRTFRFTFTYYLYWQCNNEVVISAQT